MPRRNRAPRNPVACSPLLRKGGVHTQSKSNQRFNTKLNVADEISEWRYEQELFNEETHQIDSDESCFYLVRHFSQCNLSTSINVLS